MTVTRDYSRADRELAEVIKVQPRQIERWREQGCLQPPVQSHRSGVPGSFSAHPPDAAIQADAVRALLEARPLLFAGAKASFDEVRIRLLWAGRFVEVDRLRASYLVFLGLLDRDACGSISEDAERLAHALTGRAGRRASVRAWVEALRRANAFGRSSADAAESMRFAFTVLFTLLLGGTPSDDEVIDTIDNLGFDLDDTLTARDLAFVNLDAVRAAVADAGSAEIEQARDTLKAMLHYAHTLCYLGSRLDRSLQWPALSLVVERAVMASPDRFSAMVPFVVAIRRQFLATDADWSEDFDRHLRLAEAQASMLRAVPKRWHRFIMPSAEGHRRGNPRQQQALTAAYRAWAVRHPALAELIDDGRSPAPAQE